MGDCMPSLKKVMRSLAGIAGTADIAAQECRDSRGCWECRHCQICSPILPRLRLRLPATIVEVSGVAESADITNFAVRVYRDCDGDGWPTLQRLPRLLRIRERRYCQDCEDRRECWPRLPGWSILPAENGRLLPEISTNDEIDDLHCTDCRDCWNWRECRFWKGCRNRR